MDGYATVNPSHIHLSSPNLRIRFWQLLTLRLTGGVMLMILRLPDVPKLIRVLKQRIECANRVYVAIFQHRQGKAVDVDPIDRLAG